MTTPIQRLTRYVHHMSTIIPDGDFLIASAPGGVALELSDLRAVLATAQPDPDEWFRLRAGEDDRIAALQKLCRERTHPVDPAAAIPAPEVGQVWAGWTVIAAGPHIHLERSGKWRIDTHEQFRTWVLRTGARPATTGAGA